MSIFFTLAFAIQVNAQTWHCVWTEPTADCGDIFYLYYDENDYITTTIDYSQIVTNHWNNDFYFNSDEVLFQSNSYQQSTSYYGYIKFALSGTNYFFSNPIATNTRQNNTNCFGAYGGDLVYIEKDEVLTMKFRQLNRFSDMSVLAFDTNGLTKSSIDAILGQDSMESASVGFSNLMYFDDDTDYCHDNSTDVDYPSGYTFPLGYNPEPINGLCGLDDGQTTNQEPPVPPHTLCQAGTATEIDFNGYQWTWDCLGINGGQNDSCVSYNTEPVDAVCGADDGQTLTEVDEFCYTGTLIFPSFVETTLGWTWTCAGANGGNNDFCSAYKSGLTLPELPEQDDCSQQQIPDRWFCEISNALKSIFLPDANKINELQETLNQINGRFPFNYLNVASNKFSTLKNNTNDDTMEISIPGNEGNINLDGIEPLKEKTKIFTGGLFIVGFIFWGVGYIKHFFK